LKRVALLVQYDGSNYSGWQKQKNATTVQEILERALFKITNKNYKKDFNSENSGLVPPQNVQAEEAVLGGILLDPDAIGRIADLIKPEAFYINAHQEIYRTALMLHTQGKPTDLTSMSAWLADNGSLD